MKHGIPAIHLLLLLLLLLPLLLPAATAKTVTSSSSGGGSSSSSSSRRRRTRRGGSSSCWRGEPTMTGLWLLRQLLRYVVTSGVAGPSAHARGNNTSMSSLYGGSSDPNLHRTTFLWQVPWK